MHPVMYTVAAWDRTTSHHIMFSALCGIGTCPLTLLLIGFMMQHTCAGLIQALRVTRLARNHLGCSTLGHTNLRCVVIERLLLAILQVSTSVGLRDTVSLAEALHAPLAVTNEQNHSPIAALNPIAVGLLLLLLLFLGSVSGSISRSSLARRFTGFAHYWRLGRRDSLHASPQAKHEMQG